MIQEFSVENFLSFGEKQTISFEASSDTKHADSLIREPKPGVRLLRVGVIYGANASGKTNLLKAIESLWIMLFRPLHNENEKVHVYRPFELRKGEPTRFEIVFWANKRKYEYTLEYNQTSVLYEKMTYTSDKGVQSDLYERKKGELIKFGSTIGMKAKQKDAFNKDTLSNHTVLSTINKKNIDAPVYFVELNDWLKNFVHELGIYIGGSEIAEQAVENPKMKDFILDLLNKADFNISDFNIITIERSDDELNYIRNDNTLPDKIKSRLLEPQRQLIFDHKTINGEMKISFGLESNGSRVYFRLARLLYDLKSCGCIIMEDELEDSLHYDLLEHYLQTFIQTDSSSQLIFTTHNQMLLDEDWLIRRDMVWFVEKDRNTAYSYLYRASDQGIHKNVSLFNAYKIGKLGAKPVLGSTLLNNENNE
jgi:AAA15 family ATPase/GTPase